MGNPAKWWDEHIVGSRAVQDKGIEVHPVNYVKRYECEVFDGVHYILVSMPSEVSRKIAKKTACGRAFIELGVYGSEAAITKEIRGKAFYVARLPRSSLLGWVS